MIQLIKGVHIIFFFIKDLLESLLAWVDSLPSEWRPKNDFVDDKNNVQNQENDASLDLEVGDLKVWALADR